MVKKTASFTNGIFAPLRQTLLESGDYFMHLADLKSYSHAQQLLGASYANADDWVRKMIVNVACSGRFSSDRTITEYASKIWNVEPCPVADRDSEPPQTRVGRK